MKRYSLEEKRKAMEIVIESGLPPQVFIDAGHTLRQYQNGNITKLSITWADILSQVLKSKK
ncbi:MAG: hypothetical protein PHR19_08835 [Bacteroidales bacterium]|nr:hypothetical protein [Bacteroidales bacterium]